MIIPYGKKSVKQFLALSLLMALVFGTNYHNFSVSFNDFAFVAHRLYGRSDFHFFFLLKVYFTKIFSSKRFSVRKVSFFLYRSLRSSSLPIQQAADAATWGAPRKRGKFLILYVSPLTFSTGKTSAQKISIYHNYDLLRQVILPLVKS